MLLLLAALQALLLVAILLILMLRKPAPPAPDVRFARLPEDVAGLNARLGAAGDSTRQMLGEIRREQAEASQRMQGAATEAARQLREEVWRSIEKLGRALNDGLNTFRTDNARGADDLRAEVHTTLREMDLRLQSFVRDTATAHTTAQDVLHGKLNELGARNQQSHETLRDGLQSKLAGLGEEQRQHQERIREAMQQRLDRLNQDNTAKLEEMRVTVDEKLNSTLNERLTASFGQVSEHLGQVQKGLGEMREFATGVSDLKRVFSNVKARGIVGEFQLGMQLEQMFSPEQYIKNARIKANTGEAVEFALKVPDGDSSHVLLPIDAKFPREAYERLEHAHEHGSPAEQEAASRDFERTIRTEAKRICEKYIDPPMTLPFAVMFLPTEALYAEVMRRPGLHTELQSQCRVTIAGPSSFMAILTSFQMGFRTLAIQKKGHEVWHVLGRAKTEFGKFETLMTKVENNVKTVQNTLSEIGVRTRAINRNLREVSEMPQLEENSAMLAVEEFAAVAPLLAASAAPELVS